MEKPLQAEKPKSTIFWPIFGKANVVHHFWFGALALVNQVWYSFAKLRAMLIGQYGLVKSTRKDDFITDLPTIFIAQQNLQA